MIAHIGRLCQRIQLTGRRESTILMIMFEYARRALDAINSALKAAFPEDIVSVTAFGSRARGDHTGDSDFDVLVVVKQRTSKLEEGIMGIFVEEEQRSGIFFDPVIKTEESLRLEREHHTAFYDNIEKEGIRL